jgi:GntR family transcriptional regulator, transcriptional repressor for pyruvate dehydrogenase complex
MSERGKVMADAPRAWEGVLHAIESRLLSGELQPGDHLPPERALATELGVGRSSVREAVRVLDVLGLVRTQTGSGPQAGAIIIATPSGGMSSLMRLQVAAQGFPVADIVKTRLLLESSVASGLCGTQADLAESLALLDAMDSTELTAEEFLALDAQFHVSLAVAGGNQVVTSMMVGLRSAIEGYVTAGLPAVADWSAEAAQLRTEHRGIVDAISRGDAPAAESRIRSHITGYYALTNLAEQDHR